jgi:TRAP-type C4-dicarboxylate transport system permease small subunit
MLDRIERILVAGNRWLLILLLLAMACIVFANVVLRYTTGDSIVWAEEVARHMMIWVTFWAQAWCCALAAMWPSTICTAA